MDQGRRDQGQPASEEGSSGGRSRRDLLRLGMAGAVGATAVGLLGSSPAGAAAGDPIDIDDTTTGSGGTTILQSTVLRSALQDWGGQVFNVKAYGATGNGTTDDTSAIAAAQSAAGTGCVYFPPGTYLVSGLTVASAGQTFKLESGATILLKALSTPTPVILVTAAHVSILGPGTIDGNQSAQTSANGFDGLKFGSGADDGLVQGVTVQNAAWIGIRADGANRVRIALNHVLNNVHSGISSSTLSTTFEGPLVLGNTVITNSASSSSGVNIQGGSPTVLVNSPRIIGNQVEVAAGIGVQVINCQYAKVTDNTATGPAQVISMAGGSDNVVSGNTALPTGPGAGIEFGSNNSICNGNTVNHSGTGVGITADNVAGTHVVISNNKVTGAQTQGIRIGSYDHVTVTGNVIQQFALTTPAVHGIIEVSPTGVGMILIGDNVCDGAGGFDYGVWVSGLISTVQVSIHDNAVSGVSVCAFRFSGTGTVTDLLLHDNTVASGITLYTVASGLNLGSNVRFHDNIVVGAGNPGLVGTALPASGTAYTNTNPFTEVIYLQGGVLSGSGTTNGVVKDGHVLVDSSLKLTFPMSILLQPGEAITVYYVTAPSIWKDVKS